MIILRKLFGQSDRNSEWWKKRIEEERKRNPNSPRLKKWESVLQYTLEDEGKTDPLKAQEAAKRKQQGHSSYSGNNSSSHYSGKSQEDIKKEYQEFRSKANKYARRSKHDGMADAKRFKTNAKILAGGAAIIAGYNAYNSKKQRDEFKKKQAQKAYSEKSEAYYKGEETERQKKSRKLGNSIITGTGIATGAVLGSSIPAVDSSSRALRVIGENFEENSAKYNRARYINPEFTGEVIKDMENTKRAADNYTRRAMKITRKRMAKGALKGAAIGGAIGGLAAYGNNNSVKTLNEKINSSRRHKKNDNSKK